MSDTVLDSMLIQLTGDGSSYFNMMKQAEKTSQHAAGVMGSLTKEVGMYGNVLRSYGMGIFNWATGLTSLVGIGSAIGALHLGAKLASDFEQAEIQFGVMLHSTEKAAAMMADIEKFAAETPLNTNGINQAAKTLLQFNVAGENVMPLLKTIGNAVGGDNERFQRMSLAFGQMSAAGRLMGQDLMQMVNAGFNPLQEIAKSTGKTIAQLHQEMEHGAISTNMVMKAFESASAAGGQFDGLMEKQSKSLGGLFSTLSDNVQIQLKRLTGYVFNAINLKGMIKGLSDFVNGSQKMLESWAMYFIKQAQSIYNYVAPTFMAIGKVVYNSIALATKYWNSLNAEFRTALPILTLIVVAFGPIVAAVVSLGAWIPVTTAAIIAGASAILSYFGGIEVVWNAALKAASDFYAFVKPVTDQYMASTIALWELLGEAAKSALTYLSETAQWAFGQIDADIKTTATWLRDSLVEGLLFAEFTWRNFGLMTNRFFLTLAYELVRAGERFKYIFGTVAMTYINWFVDNAGASFAALYRNSAKVFDALGKNIGEAMFGIWQEIRGEIQDVNAKPIWHNIEDGFERVFAKLPNIAERGIGELEKALKGELTALNGKIQQDFDAFKEGKNGVEKLIGDPDRLKEPIKDILKTTDALGLKMGDGIAEGVKHGTHQLEAVLLGSAKSFDVFWDYYAGKRGRATSLPTKMAKGLKLAAKAGGNIDPETGTKIGGNSFDPFVGPTQYGADDNQNAFHVTQANETVLQKRIRLQESRDAKRELLEEVRGKIQLGAVDGNSRSDNEAFGRSVANTAGNADGSAPLFSSIDTSLKQLVKQGESDTDKTEITVVDLTSN